MTVFLSRTIFTSKCQTIDNIESIISYENLGIKRLTTIFLLIISMSQRSRVIELYKTLLHLGKEYPKGYDYFRTRLKKVFMKNRDVADPDKIETMIGHGQFVVKELEALYMLRKYRTLKKRYYEEK